MANTYTLISSAVVGPGGISNIQFNSIPQNFDDLSLYLNLKTNTSGRLTDNPTLRFNGDTTIANYAGFMLRGNGSSVSSGSTSGYPGLYMAEISSATTNPGYYTPITVYIPNYISGTRKAVSFHSAHELPASLAYMQLGSGLYITSSAISSISIINNQGGNFLEGSSAYLYGIKNS